MVKIHPNKQKVHAFFLTSNNLKLPPFHMCAIDETSLSRWVMHIRVYTTAASPTTPTGTNTTPYIFESKGTISTIEEKQNTEKKEFENILSEFQSVHNKIKEQFVIDPEYFKVGIQRFVSTWKNHLTSDKSLLLACNSLSNIYQSNLDDDS